MGTAGVCRAEECMDAAVTRGYCSRHYQQVRRYGRLTPEREYKKQSGNAGECTVCDQPAIARGYCPRHYQQVRRHGRLTPERERIYGRLTCKVRGCNERHAARGMCRYHYAQEYYRAARRGE